MACIRKRCKACHKRYPLAGRACPVCGTQAHRFQLDYYDRLGSRRFGTFDSREAAEDRRADVRREARGPQFKRGSYDPRCTLAAWVELWQPRAAPFLKANTVTAYAWCLGRLSQTQLWGRRLRDLVTEDVQDLVTGLLAEGLKRKSVANVVGCLHVVLQDAVEKGFLYANPVQRSGRSMAKRLTPSLAESADRIRQRVFLWPPYSERDELALFLKAAQVAYSGHYHALFFLYSRTGLRRGEALGLQWGDLNFEGQTLQVYRSITNDRRVETPKSGLARTVDMGEELREVLQAHKALAEAHHAQHGGPRPPWVFPNAHGAFLDPSHVQKRCLRICKDAGLAPHVPSDFRHSYATRLLASGESLKYVQEQLGHADIRLTAHRYGGWMPARNPKAQEALRPRMPVGTNGGSEPAPEAAKSLSARRDSNPLPLGSKLGALPESSSTTPSPGVEAAEPPQEAGSSTTPED